MCGYPVKPANLERYQATTLRNSFGTCHQDVQGVHSIHSLWDLANVYINIYIYISIYRERESIRIYTDPRSFHLHTHPVAARGTLRNFRVAIRSSRQPAPKCKNTNQTSGKRLPLKSSRTWTWRRDASRRLGPGMMGMVDVFQHRTGRFIIYLNAQKTPPRYRFI